MLLKVQKENNTWEPCVLPEDRNANQIKWMFKRKLDAAGKVCRYKARLVCKGFVQREGVDYSETFAPVAKFSSIRLLIATLYKFRLVHLDVMTILM